MAINNVINNTVDAVVLTNALSTDSSEGNVGDILTSAGAGLSAGWLPGSSASVTWNYIAYGDGTPIAIAPLNGYATVPTMMFATQNFLLPAGPVLGDTYYFFDLSGPSWRINIAASQAIVFAGVQYTSTFKSNASGDSATITYRYNNAGTDTWYVTFYKGAPTGT